MVLLLACPQDHEAAFDHVGQGDGLVGGFDAHVVDIRAARCDEPARLAFGFDRAHFAQEINHQFSCTFERGFGQIAAGRFGEDIFDGGRGDPLDGCHRITLPTLFAHPSVPDRHAPCA